MRPFLNSSVGRLRIIGWLEGASFLLLLGVAMPLKYLAGRPEAVRVIGMAHGILFVAYVLAVLLAAAEKGWRPRTVVLLLIASVLPFGPFVADAKLLREA